jgi:hypothetical protein
MTCDFENDPLPAPNRQRFTKQNLIKDSQLPGIYAL